LNISEGKVQNTLSYFCHCKMSYFFTGMRKQAIIQRSEKIDLKEIPVDITPQPEESIPLSEEEKQLLEELFNLFIESYEWNHATTK